MDPFIAEIRMFAGNFAPRNWAFCNGQNIGITQNTTLYSLLTNIYGGNGTSNFSLPNLQGAAAMHRGQGAGLSPRQQGSFGGSAGVTLQTTQMGGHSHNLMAQGRVADAATPATNVSLASTGQDGASVYTVGTSTNLVAMNNQSIGFTGGGGSHNNMQPYLGINFIIALQGIYPQRP